MGLVRTLIEDFSRFGDASSEALDRFRFRLAFGIEST
jgi:hypothetical protein